MSRLFRTGEPSRRPRIRAALLLGAAVLSVGLTSCGSDDDNDAASGDAAEVSIKIGHQGFAESEILAHLYGDVLDDNGYKVEYQSFSDRAAIYAALDSGDIDLVPDYAASAVEFLNGNAGEATPDVDETVTALTAQLEKKNLAAGKASPAVDSNSLVVPADSDMSKISDLTDDLVLGGPQDCPSNASCLPAITDVYGVDLTAKFVPLDAGGPLTVSALKSGDIDVAVLFSTDPAIVVNDFKVLKDDKGIFNADNIIPVGTSALVGDTLAMLDKVSAALTTDNLTELVKKVAIDKEDADEVAKTFVADNKLK